MGRVRAADRAAPDRGCDMRVRDRVLAVLTLAGCLAGLVALPLGWGAHPRTTFCRTAAECPDLRWPSGTVEPVGGFEPRP